MKWLWNFFFGKRTKSKVHLKVVSEKTNKKLVKKLNKTLDKKAHEAFKKGKGFKSYGFTPTTEGHKHYMFFNYETFPLDNEE